jgi:NitT/TauT family transport system ATP-binding protein
MLPLELRGGMPRRHMQDIAAARLAEVGLATHARSLPVELSHGMRQRVALARTLATDPQVLLLDEPFSALDAQTRLILQGQFCRLTEQRGITTLLITHDLSEAIAIADNVAILTMRPARLKATVQVDISRPRNVPDLQEDDHFHALYEQAWKQLKSEVEESAW